MGKIDIRTGLIRERRHRRSRKIHEDDRNDTALYFIEREIPPLEATLKMYHRAVALLADNWPTEDMAGLHQKATNIISCQVLFPIWGELLSPSLRLDNKRVSAMQKHLREIEEALVCILDVQQTEGDFALIAKELGKDPIKEARRYVDLCERRMALLA